MHGDDRAKELSRGGDKQGSLATARLFTLYPYKFEVARSLIIEDVLIKVGAGDGKARLFASHFTCELVDGHAVFFVVVNMDIVDLNHMGLPV